MARSYAPISCTSFVPSTWNGSPRDAKGLRGPYEAALVGTPLADPEKPLEILRTVRSFDPCLVCAVHLLDAGGNEMVSFGKPRFNGSIHLRVYRLGHIITFGVSLTPSN